MIARRIFQSGKRFRIHFSYNKRLVDLARALSDRRFHDTKKAKYWSTPISPWHAHQIVEAFGDDSFEIDKEIHEMAKEYQRTAKIADSIKGKGDSRLYPFQVVAVKFIEAAEGRAILGDEMGTGKTVEALAWMHTKGSKLKHVLIVAPANVIYKWKDEVDKWLGWSAEVVGKIKSAFPITRIYIMSYAIMRERYQKLEKTHFDLIIFDESHKLKDRKSSQTRAAKRIIAGVPYVLMLTGTPFLNRPNELFTPLNMLRPKDWPEFFAFAHRYCAAIKGDMGWDFSGSSNEEELRERLKFTMIRRLKVDVLDQLPDLVRARIPVKIVNKSEYNNKKRETLAGLTVSNALTRLNKLRQVVGRGKVPAALTWVENFLVESPDQKLVIYVHHIAIVESLAASLTKHGVAILQGSVSAKDRASIIKRFQESKKPRILVMSSAGSEGIDLWRANHILFVEREWSPAAEEQAEARLHRLGQKNAVTAWYLVAQDTLDMHMDAVIETKRKVFKDILTAPDVKKQIVKEVLESFLED